MASTVTMPWAAAASAKAAACPGDGASQRQRDKLQKATTIPRGPSQLCLHQMRIHHMLSAYVSTVGTKDFVEGLNRLVRRRAHKFTKKSSADYARRYYANRPELKNYTLGVEMDRGMEYTLVSKDGSTVSDKASIRLYYSLREIDEGSSRDHTEIDTEELLIRAANQSLLADPLAALTGSEVVLQPQARTKDWKKKNGLILRGPLLNMTSAVEKCHFVVDLSKGKVDAAAILAISVPVDNAGLVLARAVLVATFEPEREEGQLQYSVTFIKAYQSPLSKTLQDAASSLAKDQKHIRVQRVAMAA